MQNANTILVEASLVNGAATLTAAVVTKVLFAF
jgi:hypothetical protein